MITVQVVLAVVVIILSSLLVGVGIQVFFILRELYTAVKRINSILGDAVLGGGLIQHGGAREFVEALKKLKNLNKKEDVVFPASSPILKSSQDQEDYTPSVTVS